MHPLTLDARHPILSSLLDMAESEFDPDDPEATGGRLIAKTAGQHCGVTFLKEARFRDCDVKLPRYAIQKTTTPTDFKNTVLGHSFSPSTFCPVEEDKHWTLIDPARVRLVSKRLNEAGDVDGPHALRLWPERNGDFADWGSKASPTAVWRAAEEACPLVVQLLGAGGTM